MDQGPNIPLHVTVEIPTPVAADVALVIGTILHRAEAERLSPTWTTDQQRSYQAMVEFGSRLSAAIVSTLREAGIPDEMIAQAAGLPTTEPTEPTDAAA